MFIFVCFEYFQCPNKSANLNFFHPVPSLVHSPELICILSDLSNLTFREEYERMNASLASACSSSEATAEESINDQPQAMNGEVADLLDCSSVEQQSKMDELLPNEGSLTIDPENSPSCSFEPPAKRMRTQDAQDPAKVEAKQGNPRILVRCVPYYQSLEPKSFNLVPFYLQMNQRRSLQRKWLFGILQNQKCRFLKAA